MTIREATRKDAWAVTSLALMLWPDNDMNALFDDLSAAMHSGDNAVFVAVDDSGVIGFAHATLRHDYVEGSTSSPVGYLEGIYVAEAARHSSAARALTRQCEAWAGERGCTQFASDCELKNHASVSFHTAVGFREANRIVCFIKDIQQAQA